MIGKLDVKRGDRMLKNSFIDLKRKLDEYQILLTFTGPLSQEIIEDLGDAITKYMESKQNPKGSTFNIFSVFVEQTQNIKNYQTRNKSKVADESFNNSGFVCIGKTGNRYFVSSGNLVQTDDAPALSARIDALNQMSREELKAAYKQQIRMPRSMDDFTPGAGLGLLDIARKSNEPIEYSFVEYNKELLYFILKVTI